MNNPFQEQLLKAGLVNKKQVQKANQEKSRKQKQLRSQKKQVDENKLKAQQAIQLAAQKKAERDRELNRQKQQQAKQKAVSAEINQLISNNLVPRDESCEIAYHFEHRKKVNRIYVNEELKQKIVAGKLGIARIEGRYELVPQSVAEKIRQRNEKRIVLLDAEPEQDKVDNNDPYADYQIPDDLVW